MSAVEEVWGDIQDAHDADDGVTDHMWEGIKFGLDPTGVGTELLGGDLSPQQVPFNAAVERGTAKGVDTIDRIDPQVPESIDPVGNVIPWWVWPLIATAGIGAVLWLLRPYVGIASGVVA